MRIWTIALLSGTSTVASAAPEAKLSAVPQAVTAISRAELEKLPVNRNYSDLLAACPAQTLPSVRSGDLVVIDGYPARDRIECVRPDDLRMIEIYKGHNSERALYGSPPLVWDPALARGAADYARQLTTVGRVHASRDGRKDIRENLLQSLNGQRSARQMVGVWTAEKRDFKYGVFPDISKSGDWSKVGHYSQMIWPTTTRLGCAIYSDAKYDWTVCRYSPPGNRDGSTLLAAPMPVIRCKVDYLPSPIGTYTYRVPLGPVSVGKDGKTLVVGGEAKPPPESILDDVGDAQGPPPKVYWDGYYQFPDHIPVKASFDTPVRPCPPPANNVIAGGDVAPETSWTGPRISIDLDRMKAGGGMTQIDPPAPPPPPPPTARDPAPEGNEARHPLKIYLNDAFDKHADAVCKGDKAAQEAELAKMKYALDELKKRLKAAKKAGRFSAVNPDDVQRQIDDAQRKLDLAEQRQKEGQCPASTERG